MKVLTKNSKSSKLELHCDPSVSFCRSSINVTYTVTSSLTFSVDLYLVLIPVFINKFQIFTYVKEKILISLSSGHWHCLGVHTVENCQSLFFVSPLSCPPLFLLLLNTGIIVRVVECLVWLCWFLPSRGWWISFFYIRFFPILAPSTSTQVGSNMVTSLELRKV